MEPGFHIRISSASKFDMLYLSNLFSIIFKIKTFDLSMFYVNYMDNQICFWSFGYTKRTKNIP